MNEKVLTSREVFPADDVKLHLGLTGAKLQPMPKSVSWICEIMSIYVHYIAYNSLIYIIYVISLILHLVCYVDRFPSNKFKV